MGNKTPNGGSKDLRIRKTQKALYDALMLLLSHRNFNDITINDLCAEALISRSTFYAHFNDKYDLLSRLLTEIKNDIVKDIYKYDLLEKGINQFIDANKKAITHLLKDANAETLALIREFMSSIVDLIVKRKTSDAADPNHIVLFNFFIGGLVNLLTWIVEHNFPSDVKMMNKYLYKMLEFITLWDAEQEKKEIIARNLDP